MSLDGPITTAESARSSATVVSACRARHRPPRTLRPLYVNTRALSAPTGGIQRYLAEVLARISVDRHVVRLLPEGRSHGVSAHLWEQWRLPRLARDGLLWSPCNSGPVDAARQVVTVHDLGPLEYPQLWSRRYAAWYRYMTPRVVSSAAHVLTVSEFTRERVHERLGVPLDRITAIPLAPGVIDSTDTAESASGEEPSYVLALGSDDPRKRIDDLVLAWRSVAPFFPTTTLRIVGATGARRVYGRRRRSGSPADQRITWLGHVPDEALPALYRGARAFVTASLYEGFGLPPLEALAFGTPVVASGIAAHREVLADAPVYFDAGDSTDLADALRAVLSNRSLRAEMAVRGRARADEFSWEVTAQRTLEVLDRCAR